MFILSFDNHPEIPERRSTFYRNVFDTLYSRHDALTKNAYSREKLTKLQRDDFEYILSIFSYITIIQGRYVFTYEFLSETLQKIRQKFDLSFDIDNIIYDFHVPISIFILDGFEYQFPHRSMQEYYTALFISKLQPEQKLRAYKNIFDILEKSSMDHSYNLWYLCYELDESEFLSVYLLPKLKDIFSCLRDKEGDELTKAYIKLIRLELNVSTKDDIWGEYVIESAGTTENGTLLFCETYDFSSVHLFIKIKGIQAPISEIISEWKKLLMYQHDKPNVFEIAFSETSPVLKKLKDAGFNELVNSIKHTIQKKINDLELKLVNKKASIDELLNIR